MIRCYIPRSLDSSKLTLTFGRFQLPCVRVEYWEKYQAYFGVTCEGTHIWMGEFPQFLGLLTPDNKFGWKEDDPDLQVDTGL